MSTSKKVRRILLWLGIIAFSLWVIYVVIGSPSLSPEMGLRRLERIYKVGPSEILWEGESCHFWYDGLLVGETDHGYCFYLYDSSSYGYNVDALKYVEKGREGCFQVQAGTAPWDHQTFQVFAMAGDPQAVEARLILETACPEDTAYEGRYTSRAECTGGVFFQFEMDITGMDPTVRNFWKDRLDGDNRVGQFISGVMTLEMFDREGNLIDTIVTEYPATQ